MKKDAENILKENLIKQGVEKLKKFGFVNVNKNNIINDEVYSLYFSKMLQGMIGRYRELDDAIRQLQESMGTLIK